VFIFPKVNLREREKKNSIQLFSYIHNSTSNIWSTDFQSQQSYARYINKLFVCFHETFNWNTQIYFLFSEKRRFKTHGRVYRFVNYRSERANTSQSPSRFVDYTSITCRFSIPIRLPDVIYVNVIIHNRDNNNATANVILKNLSEQDIRQLIEFQKKFYHQPRLPTYSTIVLSRSMNDDVTTEQWNNMFSFFFS